MFQGQRALLLGTNYSLTQVEVYRADANNYLVRVPIAGTQSVAEYRLQKQTTILAGWSAASACWHLLGLRVIEVSTSRVYTLVAQNSAWEYAGRVGLVSADAALHEFFGSIHQSQVSTGFTIALDGVSLPTLAIGQSRLGASLAVAQTMNTILPSDKATVIGTTTLSHTFTVANHCDVDYTLFWNGAPACDYHTMYSAMLPVTSESGGLDTYKVGIGAATARLYDNGEKVKGTDTDTTIWSASSAHGYKATLFLPSGGPVDPDDSYLRAPSYKTWVHDRPELDKGKAYVNFVDTGAASVIACINNTRHRTRYAVTI